MADNPRTPRSERDEPSLVPSHLRQAEPGQALPTRQSFEEMRTLGRRGPSTWLTLVALLGLLALLILLGVGGLRVWERVRPVVPVALAPTEVPPPTPIGAVAPAFTPAPSAVAQPVVIPSPPGRQPRDGANETATPDAAAIAPPTVVPTVLPPTATSRATETTFPTPAVHRPNGSIIIAPLLTDVVLTSIADFTQAFNAANAPPARIDSPVFGVTNWRGPDDCSGQLWVGWDEGNLYLLARVRDDIFVQEAAGILIYQGDSLELQFDTDLAGDFTSRVYSDDDWQIGLSPGNLAAPNPRWEWWVYRGNRGPGAPQLLNARTGDGYILGAAIPWSFLRATPRDGAVYGFAVSISDNDTPGATQQESMVSTSPVRQLSDPTSWGTLQLVSNRP